VSVANYQDGGNAKRTNVHQSVNNTSHSAAIRSQGYAASRACRCQDIHELPAVHTVDQPAPAAGPIDNIITFIYN